MTESDQRQRILIVDDTRENIDLLMELFRDEYRVSAATTPERALKLARSDQPPDIVLLDILMPGMNGYQVCATLKSDARTRNIPVVFVTAVSEVMDAAKGFDAGAVDYITKPFHPPVVKARVRLHLELRKKYQLLETYAFLDALTEVPNRRRFEQTLEDEWNRAQRQGDDLALLFFDVDYFKMFNDTYGHGQGDECLRRLATTASRTLRRSGDFLARYGGEEFVVILPRTDLEHARAAAETLSRAVDALALPHATSQVEPFVTISIGVVAGVPSTRLSPADLVAAADKALYAAKHAGRHRIVTTPLDSAAPAPV
ncbi:diguanylate cyclase domain-containing protein [Pararhodospirillum oryzae]|uniref:diguanylate cyclase n=1 Tax=Pararhodospirillum oryzae TaxID=478448 RepID=A0A512H9B0_9PROT|nr:diguanylate cyclase [Pararhodospirillum oryzae]GEO82043.1 hypothetical protein ROR02_21740 [Pararhodospirillum oryzae]